MGIRVDVRCDAVHVNKDWHLRSDGGCNANG